MHDSSIIPFLAGFTLLSGLAFGIYQYFRTRKAQRKHERSVTAETRHEPYAASDGMAKATP